jgi:hypothetical protein
LGQLGWTGLTRSDTVDTNASLLKLSRHELRQVHSATLGGIVREVPLCVTHDTGHAADDDDAAGHVSTLLGGFLEEREEGDGGEVDGGDVAGEELDWLAGKYVEEQETYVL